MLGIALVLGALSLSAHATAHTRSVSYASWEMEPGGGRVRVRASRLELSRVFGPQAGVGGQADRPLGTYLVSQVGLRAGGARCLPTSAPIARPAADGWLAFAWSVDCEARRPIEIQTTLLFDAAPSHLHFVRVALPEGRVVERVLTRSEPTWLVEGIEAKDGAQPALEGSAFPQYVGLGVGHILTGWDHLAFVIALLLLAGSLGEVARLITGFTVAHSVTLALAVLGWVRPDPPAVEAVIAFSVALVGAENTWSLSGRGRSVPIAAVGILLALTGLRLLDVGAVPVLTLAGLALFTAAHFGLMGRATRPGAWRAALTFAFGLVHGFGFAGILAEMSLPTERLAPALFGFNLGVELGQLGVVLLAWPLLRLAARVGDGRGGRWVSELGSAAVCALGVYWFATRSLG